MINAAGRSCLPWNRGTVLACYRVAGTLNPKSKIKNLKSSVCQGPVKVWPAIGHNIIQVGNLFIARQGWVNIADKEVVALRGRAIYQPPFWRHNLTFAGEAQAPLGAIVAAEAIGRYRVNGIFQAAGQHSILAETQHQVGWVADNVGAHH